MINAVDIVEIKFPTRQNAKEILDNISVCRMLKFDGAKWSVIIHYNSGNIKEYSGMNDYPSNF